MKLSVSAVKKILKYEMSDRVNPSLPLSRREAEVSQSYMGMHKLLRTG